MAEWNSKQYLKFENQRSRPALDLVNRLKGYAPEKVLDIGCGPGNSTHILKTAFPAADVLGIDNSPAMIEAAEKNYKDISFQLCDVNSITGTYDMLFSNACLQWVPDHRQLLPELMGRLNNGGILAVQFPMNGDEPLYRIIDDVAADNKWGFHNVSLDAHGTLKPNEYFDILTECSGEFDIWETTYYHNLPDHRALVEWVKGTRIRPYLAHLSQEEGALFELEIVERAEQIYPVMRNGEVILRFRRFFFTAVK